MRQAQIIGAFMGSKPPKLQELLIGTEKRPTRKSTEEHKAAMREIFASRRRLAARSDLEAK